MFEINAKSTHAVVKMYGTIQEWGKVSASNFSTLYEGLEKKGYKTVTLCVHSVGGSVTEGNAIKNILLDSKIETTVVIEGIAASMMTIVMLGARKVQAYRNSLIMIHQPSAQTSGNADTLRDQAKVLDNILTEMVRAYATKTNKAEDWIKANWLITGQDKWLTAQEAQEAGLIDEVIDKTSSVQVEQEQDSKKIINAYESVFNKKSNMKSQLKTIAKLLNASGADIDPEEEQLEASGDGDALDKILQELRKLLEKYDSTKQELEGMKKEKDEEQLEKLDALLKDKDLSAKQVLRYKNLVTKVGISEVLELVADLNATPSKLPISDQINQIKASNDSKDIGFEAALKQSSL